MPDLTSMVTDTLAKFSLSTVLSAVAILLICLVVVHLLSKLLRRLLAQTKLDERIQKYALAGIRLLLIQAFFAGPPDFFKIRFSFSSLTLRRPGLLLGIQPRAPRKPVSLLNCDHNN